MNRRLVLTAVACLMAGAGFRGYSGPKTLNVHEALNPQTAAGKGGIPVEFGDLISVDNGYLYFIDGEGTIRRCSLSKEGVVDGLVITIPRK